MVKRGIGSVGTGALRPVSRPRERVSPVQSCTDLAPKATARPPARRQILPVYRPFYNTPVCPPSVLLAPPRGGGDVGVIHTSRDTRWDSTAL